MVQVGTALQKEGVTIFDRITKELKEIMAKKVTKLLKTFVENCTILTDNQKELGFFPNSFIFI